MLRICPTVILRYIGITSRNPHHTISYKTGDFITVEILSSLICFPYPPSRNFIFLVSLMRWQFVGKPCSSTKIISGPLNSRIVSGIIQILYRRTTSLWTPDVFEHYQYVAKERLSPITFVWTEHLVAVAVCLVLFRYRLQHRILFF